jgi:hypothetical protein
MLDKSKRNLVLPLFVTISIFGMLTIIAVSLYPPTPSSDVILRKTVTGTIFLLICALGGLAGLFPRQCTGLFQVHDEDPSTFSHAKDSPDCIEGHHPSCGKFSPHTISINGRVLCAACTGLFLGALAAISGAIGYFFFEFEIGQLSLISISVGIILVAVGFLQFRFKSFLRLILNALFVFGAFLALVGIDAVANNLFVNFYIICIIVMWISTRILLSEWDHTRICNLCNSKCEFQKKKCEN